MFDFWDRHVIWTPCDRSFRNLARRLYDIRHPKADRIKRTFWPGFSRRIAYQNRQNVYMCRPLKPSYYVRKKLKAQMVDRLMKTHYRDVSLHNTNGHWKCKHGPAGKFMVHLIAWGHFMGFDDD